MQKKVLNTTKQKTFLTLEIKYSKGGLNYFNGQNEQRGYYLHATPEEIEGNYRIYGAFNGIKKFIQPAARYSEKQFNALNIEALDISPLIQYVEQKNGLKVIF